MFKVATLANGAVLVEMSVRQLELIGRMDRLVEAVDAAVQEWMCGEVPKADEFALIKRDLEVLKTLGAEEKKEAVPPVALEPMAAAEKPKDAAVKKKAAGFQRFQGKVALIVRVREVMADGVTRSVKDVAKELGEPNSYRVAQALGTYKKEFERVNLGVYRVIGGPGGGGQSRNKGGAGVKAEKRAAAPVVTEKKVAVLASKEDPAKELEETYKALRITPVGLLSEEQLKRRMKLAAAIGEADPDARSEFLKRGAQS
jgi:hypothetical protein